MKGSSKGEDRLGDFTTDKSVLKLSLMALVIGAASALVADALVWLIGLFTNLFFFQRLSTDFVSPAANHLGILVVLVPTFGGLVIGLMARYGSDKIRGHGIPERPRFSPRRSLPSCSRSKCCSSNGKRAR